MDIHEIEKLKKDIEDLHCLIRTYQRFQEPLQLSQWRFIGSVIKKLQEFEDITSLCYG